MGIELRERTSINQMYLRSKFCSSKNNDPAIVIILIDGDSQNKNNSNLTIPTDIINSSTTMFSTVIENKSEMVLYSDKLKTLLNLFSLSKKGLCSILEVSRPTLYSWLDNSVEPEEENPKKIDSLYNLVKENKLSSPLFRNYVENSLGDSNESLLQCLINQDYLNNPTKISHFINRIDELSKERLKKIQSHQVSDSSLSVSEQELILEDNLNSI